MAERASIRSGSALYRECVAACAVGAAALYTLVLRPRYLRWGATSVEARAPMLGDEMVSGAMLQATRAIDTEAPPEPVWPWLVQIGAGRAGSTVSAGWSAWAGWTSATPM
jgi:hypothetical protein